GLRQRYIRARDRLAGKPLFDIAGHSDHRQPARIVLVQPDAVPYRIRIRPVMTHDALAQNDYSLIIFIVLVGDPTAAPHGKTERREVSSGDRANPWYGFSWAGRRTPLYVYGLRSSGIAGYRRRNRYRNRFEAVGQLSVKRPDLRLLRIL